MPERIEIIFVDDQIRYRKSIIEELKEYNICAIGEASNGLECIELLKVMKPQVVVLDIDMPIMDGNRTFDYIKEFFSGTKVLILSQYDESGVIENYIRRQVMGYLPKSFISENVNILAEGIRAVNNSEPFYYSYDPKSSIRYSKMETIIIPYVVECKTSKEIGNILGVDESRIKKLRNLLYKKTNTRNATEFVKYGIQKGLYFLGKK